MARFDKNAPYENVGGAPGAAYLQSGHYFNAGFQEVELYEAGEGDSRRTLGRLKKDAGPPLTVEELEEHENSVDVPIEPGQMHWQHLKKVVEQYGGVWTNRAAALAFLAGAEPKEQDAA